MVKIVCLFLGIVLLSSGCTEEAQPTAALPAGSFSNVVSITVDDGEVPRITWLPLAAVNMVRIEAKGGTDVMWSVHSPQSNSIDCPVDYGVVPRWGHSIQSPKDLADGGWYTVVLMRWTGPEEDDRELVGLSNFQHIDPED